MKIEEPKISIEDATDELLRRLQKFVGWQKTDELMYDVEQTLRDFLDEYNICRLNLPTIYINFTNGEVGGI